MTIISNRLIHDTTVWKQGSLNAEGNRAFEKPIHFKARWEPRTEMFTDTGGKEVRSDTQIFAEVKVEVGDMIYQGISKSGDPIKEAREIRFNRDNHSLLGDQVIYKYFL